MVNMVTLLHLLVEYEDVHDDEVKRFVDAIDKSGIIRYRDKKKHVRDTLELYDELKQFMVVIYGART